MYSTKTKKLHNFVRQSPVNMLSDVFEKLFDKKIKIGKLYVLTLKQPTNLKIKSRCDVREASRHDVEDMARLEGKSADHFLKRFDDGDFCVVAINALNKVTGYAWCTKKKYHKESRYNYMFRIPSDSLYAYDGFIDKQYRLSGAWVAFQYKMLNIMHEERKRYIFTMVDCDNKNSLKSHLRFGYKLSKKLYVIKLGKRCLSKEIAIN